jgi:hypothetical protein
MKHPDFRKLKDSRQPSNRPKRTKGGGATSVVSQDAPALPAKPRKRQRTALIVEGASSKHRADRPGRATGGEVRRVGPASDDFPTMEAQKERRCTPSVASDNADSRD